MQRILLFFLINFSVFLSVFLFGLFACANHHLNDSPFASTQNAIIIPKNINIYARFVEFAHQTSAFFFFSRLFIFVCYLLNNIKRSVLVSASVVFMFFFLLLRVSVVQHIHGFGLGLCLRLVCLFFNSRICMRYVLQLHRVDPLKLLKYLKERPTSLFSRNSNNTKRRKKNVLYFLTLFIPVINGIYTSVRLSLSRNYQM